MEDMKKLTDIVKTILTDNEEARNNIWELYYQVYKFKDPRCLSSKFGTVIRSHDEYNLPPFESIARVRRKVVETFPELKGNAEVEGGRWSNEKQYEEYAREVIV